MLPDMTTAEAAESLGITPHTVRVQIANGKLRARKVGRDYNIAPSEVERYRRASLGARKASARVGDQVASYVATEQHRTPDAALREVQAIMQYRPAPKPSQRKRKVSAK